MTILLDKNKVSELIDTHFQGVKRRMALELDINPSHLSRFLKHGDWAGAKIAFKLYLFCERNDIVYSNYLIYKREVTNGN